MSVTQSPPWFGTCPKCHGRAVFAVIAGLVVGSCHALTVACYWSAQEDEAELASACSSVQPHT
ncbi:MAG: hypothetical protein ACI8RZ_005696 [Myxococcota bacterium]|jgi:hypothetical protein